MRDDDRFASPFGNVAVWRIPQDFLELDRRYRS
jgi:hypothetical protein